MNTTFRPVMVFAVYRTGLPICEFPVAKPRQYPTTVPDQPADRTPATQQDRCAGLRPHRLGGGGQMPRVGRDHRYPPVRTDRGCGGDEVTEEGGPTPNHRLGRSICRPITDSRSGTLRTDRPTAPPSLRLAACRGGAGAAHGGMAQLPGRVYWVGVGPVFGPIGSRLGSVHRPSGGMAEWDRSATAPTDGEPQFAAVPAAQSCSLWLPWLGGTLGG